MKSNQCCDDLRGTVDDEGLFHPAFDSADFRRAAARFIKLLIRARWRTNPGFMSRPQLKTWKLENISEEPYDDWQLMRMAADALAHLNREYLPRCGSGGVRATSQETPVGRLIWNLVGVAIEGALCAEGIVGGGPDHNCVLRIAADTLRRGDTVNWGKIVDWSIFPSIRRDLDQLPEQQPVSGPDRLDRIDESLRMLLQERVVQKSYSTADLAKILGKAEFTVREWCRHGRIKAEKRPCGRGNSKEWMICHAELERVQAEGLLNLGHQG